MEPSPVLPKSQKSVLSVRLKCISLLGLSVFKALHFQFWQNTFETSVLKLFWFKTLALGSFLNTSLYIIQVFITARSKKGQRSLKYPLLT